MTATTFAAQGGKIDTENAPADVKAILEQAQSEGRDSITDAQKEVLTSYKEAQFEAKLAELPEEVRVIAEKKRAGEAISEDEKDTVQAYMEANGLKHKGRKSHNKGQFNKMKSQFFENAPANIQAIAAQAKADGSDSITDAQKKEIKAYSQQAAEAKFAELPEDVQAVLLKKKAGEELTDEDKAVLKEKYLRTF